MCGIIAAVSKHNITQTLLEGLERLAYRGYDSAGIAVCNVEQTLQCVRAKGKIHALQASLLDRQKTDGPLVGCIGIAHTRWATHGKPSVANAHPHISNQTVAVVHNGIIENESALRDDLLQRGYVFHSETDTEVIAHLVHAAYQEHNDMPRVLHTLAEQLEGIFSIALLHQNIPDQLWAIHQGSPLVIGLSKDTNLIASDTHALSTIAKQFVYLETGDILMLSQTAYRIEDTQGTQKHRAVKPTRASVDDHDRGHYRHYMQKEMHDQPRVMRALLDHHAHAPDKLSTLKKACRSIRMIHIVGCGSSYHAGLLGRYWLETLAGIPCHVSIASEYHNQTIIVPEHTLLIMLSQSGETADLLASLRCAKQQPYAMYLSICNVEESSLVRESDHVLLIHAGREIGVAATKTFTNQLVALCLLAGTLGKPAKTPPALTKQLRALPHLIATLFDLEASIQKIAPYFLDKKSVLFLGRGCQYPIALEGALKLKELSYIHAEAYPAGELKHGALALLEPGMPVIVMMPKDHLLKKLQASVQEVKARGAEVFLFADQTVCDEKVEESHVHVVRMPSVDALLSPILYAIPLQLLAYHVACMKGTDVDQPRHLAKSVTVE